MPLRRNGFRLVILAGLFTTSASAQSAQVVSIQVSGLLTALNGTAFDEFGFKSGLGMEAQLRVNPGSGFSIGAGYQLSSHPASKTGFQDNLRLTGFFAEPRYTIRIASRSIRPYLAARLAALHQSITLQDAARGNPKLSVSGTAFGAGGGLVFRASRNVNIDVGAAFTSASFGNYKIGSTSYVAAGSGSSYVLKAGLNVGLGQ